MNTVTESTIAEAYRAFETAFHRGDADAISQIYTDDPQLLVPEAPIIKGRQAIRDVWARIVAPGGNTVRVITLELEEIGAWAYEVGTFEVTAPSGNVLNAGKYIVIWKQQSNGNWKIHRDIFNRLLKKSQNF